MICPICQCEFLPGRRDKVFCSRRCRLVNHILGWVEFKAWFKKRTGNGTP